MALDYFYYIVLFLTIAIGFLRLRLFDKGAKILYVCIVTGAINEILVYISKCYKFNTMPLYHIYCVVEFFIITLFFINSAHFRRKRLYILLLAILLPALGYCNLVFLQPKTGLNSNMFLLESFAVIAMSLYSLYAILVNDKLTFVHNDPYFWFWVCLLIMFSGTFFFWAVIIPISNNPRLTDIAQDIQVIINICSYIVIGTVFFFYPKMVKNKH